MKHYVAGAFGAVVLQLLVVGIVSRYVPTSTVLGPMVRILDSLSPWFLLSALGLSVSIVTFGSWRLGGVLGLVSLGAMAQFAVEHRSLSVPTQPDTPPDLRVLFFNALASNTTSGSDIVSAILKADPDVVVIAEPRAVRPAVQMMAEAYSFVSPCVDETCHLLVASKVAPTRFWRMDLGVGEAERYAVMELATEDDKSVFLAASHISKPWLSGVSEAELRRLRAQYNWFKGPVVAVGDFNVAPWSFPMRELLHNTGMQGLRMPPATWPASAGRFGVPIDQILVRDGPRVTKIRSFGSDLGSNHLGILADVALP